MSCRRLNLRLRDPQRWPRKGDWVAAKRAEGLWKDAQVIDGDELVHWLDRHAGVAEWLAVRIVRRPPGLRNLPEVFDERSLATRPPLTPKIVTADRDEEMVRALRWLNAEPSVLPLQAEAVDEAVAFLYAAVNQLPDPHRLFWMSRSVVADSDAVTREVAGLSDKLVVVLTGGDPASPRDWCATVITPSPPMVRTSAHLPPWCACRARGIKPSRPRSRMPGSNAARLAGTRVPPAAISPCYAD